ncbi:TOM1-like protein 2 [Magnolia sinica]|uniref:TOM1-like protein 2 n=1 Tax=Magnolia sinica TaxID=86752 RepID=UPI0026594A7C|nr:TOM1-like protein 2 [Magnolia sinica]
MDKLKLAALGERLKVGGERLKIGGAQVSRSISEKMKEILQGPTQEAKMVDEATSESLEEPNWGLNLRICALLNADELSGPELVRQIKKKIASKNTVCQKLSLDLLETCAMNCDKVFSEIASEKVLDDMVRMIDNPQTHYSNGQRAMQLIQAWGESDELGYLPVFHQTYMSLKARETPFSIQDDGNSVPIFSSMESAVDQEPLPLPDAYPHSNMDDHITDQHLLAHHSVTLSAEEKKEILVVTRNSIELLSSMLNSENEQKHIKMQDDLTLSMLDKCKESQPIIQRIIETTTDDEGMLFEALNLHEELQNILSMNAEIEDAAPPVSVPSDAQTPDTSVAPGNSIGQVTAPEKEGEKLISSAAESSKISSGS